MFIIISVNSRKAANRRPFARLLLPGGDWATQMIDPENT